MLTEEGDGTSEKAGAGVLAATSRGSSSRRSWKRQDTPHPRPPRPPQGPGPGTGLKLTASRTMRK